MSEWAAIPLMIGVAVATAGVDQGLKAIVLSSRPAVPNADRPALIGIRTTLNEQSGPARMSEREAVAIFALATLVVAVASLLLGYLGGIGAGLAVGGMAGNLIDQRRRKATVDYLALRNGTVGNLADIAIAVGTVLMVVALVA